MSWEEKKAAIEERAKNRRNAKQDEADKAKPYIYKEPEKKRTTIKADDPKINLWNDCERKPWTFPIAHRRKIDNLRRREQKMQDRIRTELGVGDDYSLEPPRPYDPDNIESWLGNPFYGENPERYTEVHHPVQGQHGTWDDGTEEDEPWDFPEEETW